MIRWRFVLTRIIVVAAIVMLLRYGLGPVANFVTIRGLEQVTGAKVEIAKTRVGLFPPYVQYVDLRIADPREGKEMQNAFRCDTMDFVIDGDALLHRRWVAKDGRITGLEVGSRRQESGHFEHIDDVEPEADSGPSMLGQLVDSVSDRISDEAEAALGGLETVRRSKEIKSRWEAEYESLVGQARQLEKQIRDIRDQARGIDNPLRDWPELERTLAMAREARENLLQVRQRIDSLPGQLQNELISLDEAKRIDIAKVDKFVPGDLTNTSEFGVQMMADAVRAQLDKVRGYLDGGRTIAEYTVVAPEKDRDRGVTHNLLAQDVPEVLVRRCEINGLMRADGETYALTGVLENLTPTPTLLAEPTRAKLHLEGPDIVRVEYVRDRRNDADVDLVTVHWPEMEAKSMRLGNPSDAAISVDGGVRELWVQIRSEGDNLSGRFVSKQTGLKMNLQVDPKYAESPAAISLSDSLAAVYRIEIDAHFDGTWRDLDLDVNTNITHIFQDAAKRAIAGQFADAKAKAIAKIDKAHLEQTLELREWLTSRQSEAQNLLASADKSIEEMSQKVLSEVGDADAYLGRLRSTINNRLLR